MRTVEITEIKTMTMQSFYFTSEATGIIDLGHQTWPTFYILIKVNGFI